MDRSEAAGTVPILHSAGLGLLALVTCWAFGPLDEPILGDRAYFVYLGQAIADGIPIYANTFFGYPPLGPMLAAGAMEVGGWLGVPSWLAPRFAGIAVFVASVVLAYHVTRAATRSDWAGALAAIAMMSFSHFGSFSVANLEPKNLVALLTWAAAACLQRGRPGAAGVALGAAGMCWQIAIIPAFAVFLGFLWSGRERPVATVLRFGVGIAVAIVPVAIYLTLSDSWSEFWLRAIERPLTSQIDKGNPPMLWLAIISRYWRNEIVLLAAGAAGFAIWLAAWIFTSARGGVRAAIGGLLDPRLGGMPLLTAGWVYFNRMEFQGPPDLLPMLPCVAFWLGWLAAGIAAKTALAGPTRRAVAAFVLAVAAVYGLADAWLHEPGITLDDERALVSRILRDVADDDTVMAFEVTELYVLGERRAPLPFLSLNVAFISYLDSVDPRKCPGLREEIVRARPKLVAVAVHRYQSYCVHHLMANLLAAGYRAEDHVVGWNRHVSYRSDPAELDSFRWRVLRRYDGPRPRVIR